MWGGGWGGEEQEKEKVNGQNVKKDTNGENGMERFDVFNRVKIKTN